MSENNKKYGEAWRAELMKWRKSEIIDFLKDTLVCNRIHRWHYPSKGELPRLDVRVLAYNGYGLTIAHRWNFNWHDERGAIINSEIIAWQYLPEPPKEIL